MKKKVSNLSLITLSLSIILVIIITFSIVKINTRHEEKLIYAMESKIEYNAKRCYLEKVCNDVITLKILYENKYLEEVIHPVTKEIISPETIISYDELNDKINIEWK